MLRKTLCCILSCIAILCLTAPSVLASGNPQESRETGSIAFDFSSEEAPVTSGSVELRQVARWDLHTRKLIWLDDYAPLALDPTDLGEEAAAKLHVYALAHSLPARELRVDANGKVRAEGLELGVYLVTQEKAFEGYTCILPALISVPLEINGELIYDVEAAPKLSPNHDEDPPDPPEPGVPELPPTGQVNWPIPVLLVGGLFLVILGFWLRKKQTNETET